MQQISNKSIRKAHKKTQEYNSPKNNGHTYNELSKSSIFITHEYWNFFSHKKWITLYIKSAVCYQHKSCSFVQTLENKQTVDFISLQEKRKKISQYLYFKEVKANLIKKQKLLMVDKSIRGWLLPPCILTKIKEKAKQKEHCFAEKRSRPANALYTKQEK